MSFGIRLTIFSVNSDAGLGVDAPKPPLAFFLGARPQAEGVTPPLLLLWQRRLLGARVEEPSTPEEVIE